MWSCWKEGNWRGTYFMYLISLVWEIKDKFRILIIIYDYQFFISLNIFISFSSWAKRNHPNFIWRCQTVDYELMIIFKISLMKDIKIINHLLRNVLKWSDTLKKSCSKCCKILKVCLTILRHCEVKG